MLAPSRLNTKTHWAEKLAGPAKIALFFLLYSALLMLPYLNGHWRLADDAYEISLPNFLLQERTLRLGEWPQWNTNVGLGQPWAISSGASMFYPLQILWGQLVGWSELSYLYYLILHFWIGGLVAYRFSRKIGMDSVPAILAATAFVANGYVIGYLSNLCLILPILWWPLLGIGLFELRAKEPRLRLAIACICSSLVMIETSGYPLTKLLVYLTTAAAYIFIGRDRSQYRLPILFAASACAILITTPEWFTQLQALSLSSRMGTDIYRQYTYGAPTNYLAISSLLLPNISLVRNESQFGMTWLERSWWIGTVPLAMIGAAYFARATQFKRWAVPACISLAAFLFSLGGHSIFRELTAVVFPLLSHLRFSSHGRLIPMLFLIFLGAQAFQDLIRKYPLGGNPSANRTGKLWVAYILIVAIFGASEFTRQISSEGVFDTLVTGWRMGFLHLGLFLLLIQTAFQHRWVIFGKHRWHVVALAIHVYVMLDIGYAFRRMVATPTSQPPAGHQSFALEVPAKNYRNTDVMPTTPAYKAYTENLKVFDAYNPPYMAKFEEARTRKDLQPYFSKLVSCEAIEPGSCENLEFVIDRYFGNRIEIHGNTRNSVRLIIHDLPHSGWQAQLNENPVPVESHQGFFKAIQLPGNQAFRLQLRYRDPALPTLWTLSGLGLLSLLLICAFLTFHGEKKARKAMGV